MDAVPSAGHEVRPLFLRAIAPQATILAPEQGAPKVTGANDRRTSMQCQAVTRFAEALEPLDRPDPAPQGTQVLVKVTGCGVCHSDVHIRDGYFDLGGGARMALQQPLPLVLGHEIEGVVAAIGPQAAGVHIGQRVAVYPWIGCGQCAACRREEENYCPQPANLGIQRFGGYASVCLVPDARYLIGCDGVAPGLAAAYMCSGLTAYGALKKVADAKADDPVLIVGYGGLGMMAHALAKALIPQAPILAADIAPSKRAAAKAAGLSVYDPSDKADAQRLLADTAGVYAALDFVGSEESFSFANASVRRGGAVIVVGLYGGAFSMPLPTLPFRALRLQGSYVGTLAEAREVIALARSGKVAPIPILPRPLSQAETALADLKAGRAVGRIVLQPDPR